MSEAAVAERPKSSSTQLSFRLVDADAHLDPPYEMWRDYLPAQLRELAPYIEEGDECDYVVFEGSKKPIRMIGNQAGRAGKDFKMVGKKSDITTFPRSHEIIRRDFEGIPEKDVREICSTRAAKLYGVQ